MESMKIIPEADFFTCSTYKTADYLQCYWPYFYGLLQKLYPGDKLPCQIYMFYNDIPEHPKCVCGKPLKYISPGKGFQHFCSVKCATNSPEVQAAAKKAQTERYGGVGFASKKLMEMTKKTIQERFGVDNSMHSEEIKARLRKTNLERYGVEQVFSAPEIRNKARKTQDELYGGTGLGSPVIKKRIQATQEELYGGVGLASPIILKRAQKGVRDKYGVPYCSVVPEVKEKIKLSRVNTIKEKYPMVQDIYWENGLKIYVCKCPHPGDCNKCPGEFKIFNEQFYRRMQDKTELCTVLLPYQHPFQSNTSVEVFVKMILDKLNIKYIQNERTIIGPQELDFYLPGHHIGIECNGCKWHSTEYKDPKYHLNKYNACKKVGVQLLSLWEDWIVNSPKIVESILTNKLGLSKNKIGARSCDIRMVGHKEASSFLLSNHIQGPCNASEHIGLYHHNELISMMSFGSRRPAMGTGGGAELLRFCNKVGWSVMGAASRILKYYLSHHSVEKIVSFSSNDISNGHLYSTLGFREAGTNSSYWYIGRDYKRYHRFTFAKAKLVKMGCDPNLTEKEIMRTLPYYCIYDSGQTKWELKVSDNIL